MILIKTNTVLSGLGTFLQTAFNLSGFIDLMWFRIQTYAHLSRGIDKEIRSIMK